MQRKNFQRITKLLYSKKDRRKYEKEKSLKMNDSEMLKKYIDESILNNEELMKKYNSKVQGLNDNEVKIRLSKNGKNIVIKDDKKSNFSHYMIDKIKSCEDKKIIEGVITVYDAIENSLLRQREKINNI